MPNNISKIMEEFDRRYYCNKDECKFKSDHNVNHDIVGRQGQWFKEFLKEKLIEIAGVEVCICSAIKFLKDGVEVIIMGHRHCDCFRNVAARPDREKYKQVKQGFMTTKNRFVDRVEGLRLQKEAGIKSANHGAPYGSHLSSEDLY
jgi:hypothetical protein